MDERDDLCPDRRYKAGFAEEDGRQAATMKWWLIKWGGIGIAGFVALSMVWGAIGSFWSDSWAGKSVSFVAERKVTPCWLDKADQCGTWAHPTEWFGSGEAVADETPAAEPVQNVAAVKPEGSAEPTGPEVADTRPCANDSIPGSCKALWVKEKVGGWFD